MGPAKVRDELDLTRLDFVGCEAVPMSPGQYRLFEGRLEVWDAELKTAWMVREWPPTFIHESPSQRLAGLAERIAAVRGSPIAYCGALGLIVADPRGDPRRVMRPDQAIYVNPTRAELEGQGAILVGEHRLPDLVMEVDNTTDVRRGKLKLYESWGFPELWVEVPDQQSPSRPAGLRPGLTIHLLESGSYRISPESRAFPGWRAVDIHAALNEFALSERSLALVEGMGRLLGAHDGTGPDDDPMLRSLREESRAEGRTEVRARMVRESCWRGASSFPRGFWPTQPRSPNCRKAPSSRRRWPAATNRISCCALAAANLEAAFAIPATEVGRSSSKAPPLRRPGCHR